MIESEDRALLTAATRGKDHSLMHHETLAAVVHDLRLPLSHIKGFVTALRRTDVEFDQQTRADFLSEVELETDRLAELVDVLSDTLSPKCSTPNEPHLQDTHPASVIDASIDRVRGL